MKFLKYTNLYLTFFFIVFIPTALKSSENQEVIAISQVPKLKVVLIGNDSLISKSEIEKSIKNPFIPPSVILPFHLNSISFLFDTTHIPHNLFYQYFLEGFDTGWRNPSSFPFKEYVNLPGGHYIFHARYENSSGPGNIELNFPFKVLPPFYRTGVAFLLYLIFILLFLLTISRLRSYRFARERFRLERIINERTNALVREKDKSENLLANVLPKDTANELKLKGRATKKKYQMVTVLFSDIQGFTKIAEQMNPEKLIDELDSFFYHFDSVVEKYNIEKIKTIGDAYMCAGGIPVKNRTNPIEVVLAGLEVQQYMREWHLKAEKENNKFWDIRIGIHTGAVIAGVVGQKKLSYDIWGDTVNTASRMESSGVAGKVNISGSTYELAKDFFICEYRGKMPVKYKGEIDMYFVKGIRPDLSTFPDNLPNEKFNTRLKLLRLNDMEDMVKNKIETDLSPTLHYHNLKHTIHVYTQVELLGRAENLTDEEMLCLRTAGLLHDMGFLVQYEDHEKASSDFANEILPSFSYREDEIKLICTLIMATKPGHKPETKLEQIIIDANSNYLGRIDFESVVLSIYRELKENNKVESFEVWKKQMYDHLSGHQFYTPTALLLRDVSLDEQIKKLDLLQKPG